MTHNDHNNDPLSQRVFQRIAGEHLVPRPRWEFRIKNYFFWTLGACAVVLGALAFSATLFEITNVDWRLSVATHPSFFSFFLAAAPFLWVFALAFFIAVGYVNIRQTNHGYRYSLAIIALGAVLMSLTLGSGLYVAGLGGVIEESIGDHPPFYRPILLEERSWWLAPERGLLVGDVMNVAPDITSFVLRDFSGRFWEVEGSDLHNPDLAAVARGGVVRVVGVPAQEGASASTTMSFHACFVFPWEAERPRNKPLPLPLAAIASSSERSATTTSSEECRNIRPYRQLRSIDDAGF